MSSIHSSFIGRPINQSSSYSELHSYSFKLEHRERCHPVNTQGTVRYITNILLWTIS